MNKKGQSGYGLMMLVLLGFMFVMILMVGQCFSDLRGIKNKRAYCNSMTMDYEEKGNYCFDARESELRRIQTIEYDEWFIYKTPIKFKLVKEVVTLE